VLPSCETPDAWTTAVVRGVPLSLPLPADIVRAVMTGQEPPSKPHGDDGQPPPPDTGMGMTAVSYLLGGMLVWGGIGWLVDHFVGTRGIFAGIGAVVGIGGGVYLIVRRLGA
jgi:ATP synthase protein I